MKGVYPSQGAHVFSPFVIPLKREHFDLVSQAIKGFFSARNSLAYLQQNYSGQKRYQPKNFSVLMSYDFHMTDKGPKLVEINTNAGQSLYANALYEFKKESTAYLKRPFLTALKESFFEEAQLSGIEGEVDAAVIDDMPQKQFFYPEFLMMADLMESWGWNPFVCSADILKWDASQRTLICTTSGEKINFVYNRLTDFYFEKYPHLKTAFENGVCISPNPFEYDLLANKSRLVEFSEPGKLSDLISHKEWQDACQNVLAETKDILQSDPQELWANRKKYFFKPKTSFAGKGAYRGENIQRKVFDDLCQRDYIVQEFVRAPEIELTENGVTSKYKYDVRFYVYKDEIQLVASRLYKGQVTNFRAEGSGLCTVALV